MKERSSRGRSWVIRADGGVTWLYGGAAAGGNNVRGIGPLAAETPCRSAPGASGLIAAAVDSG